MEDGCEVCEYLEKRSGLIWDWEHWAVHLHPDQRYLGRCVVACKHHIGSLSDLRPDHWVSLHYVIRVYECALRREFQADLFNWCCLMNYGAVKPCGTHVHWHVRPRYRTDKVITVLGVEFRDREFGQIFKNGPGDLRIVSREVYDEILRRIKGSISWAERVMHENSVREQLLEDVMIGWRFRHASRIIDRIKKKPRFGT